MSDNETGVAVGHLIDWKKADGRKPAIFIIGGVRAQVWTTVKDDDGDPVKNPTYSKLKAAAEDNTAIKVKYEIQENGKWKNNVVISVSDNAPDEADVAKGDKASEEIKAKSSDWKKKQGSYADENWTAARWACSTVLEGMGEDVDLSKKETIATLVKNATALGEASLKVRDALKAASGKDEAKGSAKAADEKPEEKEISDF